MSASAVHSGRWLQAPSGPPLALAGCLARIIQLAQYLERQSTPSPACSAIVLRHILLVGDFFPGFNGFDVIVRRIGFDLESNERLVNRQDEPKKARHAGVVDVQIDNDCAVAIDPSPFSRSKQGARPGPRTPVDRLRPNRGLNRIVLLLHISLLPEVRQLFTCGDDGVAPEPTSSMSASAGHCGHSGSRPWARPSGQTARSCSPTSHSAKDRVRDTWPTADPSLPAVRLHPRAIVIPLATQPDAKAVRRALRNSAGREYGNSDRRQPGVALDAWEVGAYIDCAKTREGPANSRKPVQAFRVESTPKEILSPRREVTRQYSPHAARLSR